MAPKSTTALVLRQGPSTRKPVLHDVSLESIAVPEIKPGQLLVRMNAVAFNHRDLWIRKGQYPGIAFDSVLGADGAGIVVAAADKKDPLLHKRVFLTPMRGWESGNPSGPITILGGVKGLPIGTFSQYVPVERDQVILSPNHLDDEHVAAWPLGGLTAWRATIVNAGVKQGDNVLITGVGGGVALLALQLCLARGAHVFVSSGSEEKIRRAVELGAKGGVNYKHKDWPAQLAELLVQHRGKGALLDAVVDSGGGDVLGQLNRILKAGGKVVVYGMTANPKMTFTMREVMRNHQLIGSTMGSHQDLIDATEFLAEHKIVPVVSHVLDGLESVDEGFQLIQRGEQFGKVVMRVRHDDKLPSKL